MARRPQLDWPRLSGRGLRSRLRRVFHRPRISLALAGGGCKAFFSLGVGKVLIDAGLPIHCISGTSAGSAMAMGLIGGFADDIVRFFCQITHRNRANFYWSRLFRRRNPFPHERMYRMTLRTFMDLERLRASPIDLRVNALRVPPHRFPYEETAWRYRLVWQVLQAYRAELKYAEQGIYRPFLEQMSAEAGLEEIVFSKADLDSPERGEDVVMAASSAPPIVRFQKLGDGFFYLDGGIKNNLPVDILPRNELTVAVYYDPMTRRLLELSGRDEGRNLYYVAPSRTLPITSFDYSNAKGVRETYELGLRAGEQALSRIERLV